MNILILGHDGLLGNCVHKYLSDFYNVDTTTHRCPSHEFIDYITNYTGDYIINCIGRIPQKEKSNFNINCYLPILLDTLAHCNVVHPATDCEKDKTPYGISKRLATEYLINFGSRTKIIQSSIIGIEKYTNNSLLSWAIAQTGDINGYSSAMWNGVTTLQWAKKANEIIKNWQDEKKLYKIGTKCISKYELLNLIKDVFHLKIHIDKVEGVGYNKCIEDVEYMGDIKTQLLELKNFYE